MNLPTIDQLDVEGKRVLVRGDLDVDLETNTKRLEVLLPTINTLLEKHVSKIIIIGHRGRPTDENRDDLSTKHLVNWFSEKLEQEVGFMENFESEMPEAKVVLFENIRFWNGEEENNEEFLNQLVSLGEAYVNEAFGSSHREHASIVGLPKKMSHAAGLRFAEEVSQLSKLLDNPKRPFISLLSGAKEDKLSYLPSLIEKSDLVLVGGRLPDILGDEYAHPKVYVSRLLPDKEDITLHSVERYEEEAAKAGTILVGGPVGKFEEEGHLLGTNRVFEAIAQSDAFKVAGGGDTEAAIAKLGLEEKFDWISTGGGAMLDLISTGTLPGIVALNE